MCDHMKATMRICAGLLPQLSNIPPSPRREYQNHAWSRFLAVFSIILHPSGPKPTMCRMNIPPYTNTNDRNGTILLSRPISQERPPKLVPRAIQLISGPVSCSFFTQPTNPVQTTARTSTYVPNQTTHRIISWSRGLKQEAYHRHHIFGFRA